MNEKERLQWEKSIRKEKNNRNKFDLIQELAELSTPDGNLEYVFHLYQQALDISQKIDDAELEYETLIDLGKTNYSLGKIDDAIDCLHQARQIARAMRDFRKQHRIEGILGMIHARTGDFQLVIDSFSQAVDADNIAKRALPIVIEEQSTTHSSNQIQDITKRSIRPSPALRVSSEIKLMKRISLASQRRIYLFGIVFLIAIIGISSTIFSLLPNYLGVALLVILVVFLFIFTPTLIYYMNENKAK